MRHQAGFGFCRGQFGPAALAKRDLAFRAGGFDPAGASSLTVCVVTPGAGRDEADADAAGVAYGDPCRRVQELEAEHGRLRKLLQLTGEQARLPAPAQTTLFERTPGGVDNTSPPEDKLG